jgi:uncharacterized RDD family membrane protein YckC
VSAERPPGGDEDDDDRGLTSGDPLRAEREDEPVKDAPPPPWRRDPAPEAEHAFGAPEAPSRPPAPREGSVAPPGYGGSSSIPPGVTLPPRPAPAELPQPGQRYVLSGWWRRVGAQLIDGIVIGVVVTIIIILITAAAGGVGFLGGDTTGYGGIVLGLLFSMLIATAVALLYAPMYMARTNGQTLGKQAMGIRVVRPKGQPVDFLWSVLREVIVKTLLFAGIGGSFTFGLAWLLDVLWPLWDDENRALHDLIVDSRVVRA